MNDEVFLIGSQTDNSWVIPSEWVFWGGVQLDFYHLQDFSQTNSTATAGTVTTNSCKYYLMQTPCLFISPPLKSQLVSHFLFLFSLFPCPFPFFSFISRLFYVSQRRAQHMPLFLLCPWWLFSRAGESRAEAVSCARHKPKGFTTFKQMDSIIHQPL